MWHSITDLFSTDLNTKTENSKKSSSEGYRFDTTQEIQLNGTTNTSIYKIGASWTYIVLCVTVTIIFILFIFYSISYLRKIIPCTKGKTTNANLTPHETTNSLYDSVRELFWHVNRKDV